MPSQAGYFDTLKSVAGKVFTYLASITLTGTDGKTITCTQDTSLDEAVAMSSKAPKANPVFTGNVKGATGDQCFAAVNETNVGVFSIGGGVNQGDQSLLDNQSMTITLSGFGALIKVDNMNTGGAALFFVDYSATIVVLSDSGSEWVTTDVDSSKLAIFKSASTVTVTIKNYANATRKLVINVIGNAVASSTAPA